MSILTKITENNTLPLTGHEKETFKLNLKNITIFSLIVFFCSCKNIKEENEIVTNLSGHAVDSVLLNAKDRMFKIPSIRDSLIRKKETGLKMLLCEFI